MLFLVVEVTLVTIYSNVDFVPRKLTHNPRLHGILFLADRRHPTASSLGQGRNRDYRTPVVCGEGRRALSTGQQGATEGEEDRKAEDVQEEVKLHDFTKPRPS